MPHQRLIAEVGGEYDPVTGIPYYREIIVTVPRQTGKTTLYLAFQIHRCTSPRWPQPQRSAFTAQSGKDARDKWLDELFPLMRRSRKLMPLIYRFGEGMGNESVRFKNGSLIRILSSSSSSGHSKTLHQAVLDEIWHDKDWRREQGLRPAMITIADAQLLVCSTAGDDESVVLAQKVEAGRAAAVEDSGRGVAFFEFSAPDGWDPTDEDSYFGFMPALCPAPPCRCGNGQWRHTVTLDAIRSERVAMKPEEFARAYGNIPVQSGTVTDLRGFRAAWPGLADARSQPAGRVAIGLAIERDLAAASIAVGGRRADGLGHGEVVEHREGTAWLVDRVMDLVDRWNPCAVVLNPSKLAAAVEKELLERGLKTRPEPGERRLHVVGGREYASACVALVRDVADGRWRHLGQRPLDDSVRDASTRKLADLWAFDSAPDAMQSPLEAVTLARHGFMTHGHQGQFFGSWR